MNMGIRTKIYVVSSLQKFNSWLKIDQNVISKYLDAFVAEFFILRYSFSRTQDSVNYHRILALSRGGTRKEFLGIFFRLKCGEN